MAPDGIDVLVPAGGESPPLRNETPSTHADGRPFVGRSVGAGVAAAIGSGPPARQTPDP